MVTHFFLLDFLAKVYGKLLYMFVITGYCNSNNIAFKVYELTIVLRINEVYEFVLQTTNRFVYKGQ